MTISIRPKASDLIFTMSPQERKNATFKANAKLNELMAKGEYDLDITNIFIEVNKGYGDDEVSVNIAYHKSGCGSTENLGNVAFFATKDEAYAWIANGRKSTRWLKKTLEAASNNRTQDLPFNVSEINFEDELVVKSGCEEELVIAVDAKEIGGYTLLEEIASTKAVNDKIMGVLLPRAGTWTGTDEHGKVFIVNRLSDGSLTYTIDYVVSEEATTASVRKKAGERAKMLWASFGKPKQEAPSTLALPQK